ncbi:chemotaxis-specific protein-glutamate methyltransferase CheB [Sphingomonas sp. ID1715]|uniref:chemotaxis-specific protein-glutamate methyltransferase CheB n=1 Tax=Sphingomonas sp. ID1715 TaxID=1656898 RepID=UPI00148795A0|nr:chemotaxis-specific protein-glutamate methyltransferase CheB [Sphingomonas sp. ID1715]NNM75701.1 chemotaxis-specific protein-glutamate methyltransferase CheB [Sphingomonas sp. ID1715]
MKARQAAAEARPIRLLIVDDSAVARAVFARMVGDRREFEIAATVPSASAALVFLASQRVDIILLDIEMPGQDGLTALPALLEASRGARVLIVSSSAEQGAEATIRALTLGAADTLAKPGAGTFGGRFADLLAEKLIRIGHAPDAGAARECHRQPNAKVTLRRLGDNRVACLAIGASTGGLHALSDLLRGLPPSFAVPILITQHLPPSFMPIFAGQVQEMSGRPTAVARAGMPLARGRIIVAPGEGHLCVELGGGMPRVRITNERVESGCLPSVDPMFASVADVFGVSGIGVVLSGMGRDGLRGAEQLAAIGADLFVQDRDSSVVWGMPGAVATAGLASAMLPPFQIADLLSRRERVAA